jgi:hypothetical protein
MSHPRGIHSHCPEAPSTINVTHNSIKLDGNSTIWADDQFIGSEVVAQKVTLSKVPYSPASVDVILNSGVQRLNVDYTISGDIVTFSPGVTIDPSDIIHVKYVYVAGGLVSVTGSDIQTGSMMGFGGTVAPEGWLKMDGAQKVHIDFYGDLYAFLDANKHLTVEGTGGSASGPDTSGGLYYTLANLTTSYFDGVQLVAGTTIIKY